MRAARTETAGGGEARHMAKKKRTGALAFLVIAVMLVLAGLQLLRMQDRIEEARTARDAIVADVAQQAQENASLEAALERAEDPEYLQELARDQLNMVSPGQKDFYDVSN